MRPPLLTALLIACWTCVPQPASAGPPKATVPIALAPFRGEPCDLRCELAVLRKDARAGGLWWGGWLAVNAALGVGQLAIALEAPRQEPALTGQALRDYRGRYLVGAATAAIGVIFVGQQVPPGLGAVARIERQLAAGTLSEEQAAAAARRILLASAAQERGAQQALSHLGGLGLNFVAAVINAVAFHAPAEGFGGFIIGSTIAEAQIVTRPRAAWRLARRLAD